MGDRTEQSSGIRRRTFLIGGACATVLGLGLWQLRPKQPPASLPSLHPGLPAYGDWRDIYREKWQWDEVARGSHTSANCVSACAWNLFVRDGFVWREEQSAPYAATDETLPDPNPRGCQKGGCFSDLSSSPSRVTYPMRRAGARGEDRWKRISWQEALDEVAENLVEVLAERGGAGAVCEVGGNTDFGPTFVSFTRFFRQIGVPITDPVGMVGDLPVGGTITLGEPWIGGSSDDWFRSRYLVLWAFNAASTRIPDAHFLNEARYHGARVIAITPDLTPTATHSDLWLPIRPGSDAALALSACHVVLEEGLYDADYLREQTDLPFLVREDSDRFLRESDVREDGNEALFALWDANKGELLWAPGCEGSKDKTLELPRGVRPALEVDTEVRLASGKSTRVGTVFSRLRQRLSVIPPEVASTQTGLSEQVIRQFARGFAAAPSALILSGYGMCKNYHGDLMQRAQILLASLTGNIGKAGGGWRSAAFVPLDGFALMSMQDELSVPDLIWLGVQSYLKPVEVEKRFMALFIPSTIFHAVHGGLAEMQTRAEYGDSMLADGAGPYLQEAVDKGHFPIGAKPEDGPPDFILNICGNVLRHSRMGERLRDGLFSRARLVVDVTFRMSETARHADILLPAADWYEKFGFKYIPSLIPYVHLSDRAVPPAGESKSEWAIFALLARHVQAAAKRKGLTKVTGFRGDVCNIEHLFERFTDRGRFGPEDDEKVMEFLLQVSAESRGMSLDDLRREGGAMRVQSLGKDNGPGMHCEYDPEHPQPIVPLRDNLENKHPYLTMTGRQQFYIDHPWYLELDEALPTYKAPPTPGGDHPFTMTGAHTRWSIHAIWRDHALMLRLQRGEPVLLLNPDDAAARNIADHDWIRVWNDLGGFEAHAKLAAAVRPKQAHIFHAWEPFQFRKQKSHQAIIPSPLKVTQLVGDYGHLKWSYGQWEPNQVDRDTRVDVERIHG